jgi:hypothetical protein
VHGPAVVEAWLALHPEPHLAPDAVDAADEPVTVALLAHRDGHEILDLADPSGVR